MQGTQIIAERIKEQAKIVDVSVKKLLSDCEIGPNTVQKLSKGTDIVTQNLVKIANFLGCSTDYLLGRTDNPNITADTYINGDNNNNGTQAINGSVSVTAHAQEKQQDSLTEQFLQRFDSLSFEDKLVIMQYVQDIKKAPSEDGDRK